MVGEDLSIGESSLLIERALSSSKSEEGDDPRLAVLGSAGGRDVG
jgi:hypothetical protein